VGALIAARGRSVLPRVLGDKETVVVRLGVAALASIPPKPSKGTPALAKTGANCERVSRRDKINCVSADENAVPLSPSRGAEAVGLDSEDLRCARFCVAAVSAFCTATHKLSGQSLQTGHGELGEQINPMDLKQVRQAVCLSHAAKGCPLKSYHVLPSFPRVGGGKDMVFQQVSAQQSTVKRSQGDNYAQNKPQLRKTGSKDTTKHR